MTSSDSAPSIDPDPLHGDPPGGGGYRAVPVAGAAEERLRLALEAGEMGAWEWRIPEGRVVWSETLERIHGLAPGTFAGTFEEYQNDIHPDDRATVLSAIQGSLAGEPHRLRYRIIRPDGAVRWLEARGTLLRDPSGAPLRLVGICTDVTDRERAEAAMRLLADAGQVLHATLDVETTLQAVAHLAVPTLADYCVFDVVEDAHVRRIAAAHVDSDRQALVAELLPFPPDLESDAPVAGVIRTGRPLLAPAWDDASLPRPTLAPPHLRVLERLGACSLLSVPVVAADARVLGAMTFVMAESKRRHDVADLELANALAVRAASAIENARLHRAVVEAHERLAEQAVELEVQTVQLQDQAAEMEAQQAELEQQTEELRAVNDELQQRNDELREARDAADVARAHIAAILGAIADPFVVNDREWRYRYVNDAAARVFGESGRSREQIVGRVMWDLYPDLVGTHFEREMRRAQEERVPVVFSGYYPKRGRWTEQRCYPLADGGVATMWRDITEQKQAEEQLHFLARASEILASSLDYTTTVAQVAQLLVPRLADWCGVQLVDDRGVLQQLAVAHVDPAKVEWARELNRRYPVDMEAPTGAANVLRTGRAERYVDITDEMLQAGARDAAHLEILRQLGMTSVLFVPLIARGRTIGVMTLVAAESGRRYGDAEQALAAELAHRAAIAIDNAHLHTQTEQANRAKSDFLAHMSHELRTPLNAIAGYAELMALELHGTLTPEQREDVERIRRSQHHLLGLINDVLNFAKLEAGRVHFDIRPLAVGDAVAAVEALIAPQLAARSLRYECAPIDPELAALADAEKLQQILLNLLSNAAKFTEPGGCVSVAAERAGSTVRIAVRDTGAGIPADKHEAIFEPFVQLERTLSSAHQGTGLGLAISRDLARGMGGDLLVDAKVGEGSTFTVVLPAAE